MNKKQLYENIMTSVAKEVKKVLNEGILNESKYVFSNKDLKEIKKIILEDEDFYNCYCKYANFDQDSNETFEDAVDDFMNFLMYDVFSGDSEQNKHAHEFYILDGPDLGCSWCQLKSGKYVDLDNIYTEFKSVIQS